MDYDSFVLAASTGTLQDEPQAREDADVIEFRMDLALDPLDELVSYDGVLPIIVTNRVDTEGGQALPSSERIDVLFEAIEQPPVTAVDIEFSVVETGDGSRVINHAREHEVTTIVSTHDFEGTPSVPDIKQTLRAAGEHGDIAKFATTANTHTDVLDLLTATHELTQTGHSISTMAMGDIGRYSRVITPLYGSKLGYAPLTSEQDTAPGQYDLATLRSLLESI